MRAGVPIRRKPGGKPQTPAQQEQSIVAEYESGKGATTVANTHGVSKATVYNILRRFGKGRRPRGATRGHAVYERKGRVTERDTEILHISDQTARYSLRKQGLFKPEGADWSGETHPVPEPKRPAPVEDTSTLRKDAFDDESPEAMYWAGFLMADGCIHKPLHRPSYRLYVRLAEADICVLERLRSWLKAETTITTGDAEDDRKFVGRRYAVLQVTSNELCCSLMALGVVPNKTGVATAHESCIDSPHFWRGMVDGDGSVYEEDTPRIYLSGSKPITLQFIDFVIRRIPGSSVEHRFHESWCCVDGCWVATVGRRDDVRALARLLYDNDVWALPRKKDRAVCYYR